MSVHIVFTARPNIFSRLIRWLSRGTVSHVMIQYASELWTGDWIAEAASKGVHKIPAERARHNVTDEFEVLFDPTPAFKIIRWHIGEFYDFTGIARFGWMLAGLRWFHTKLKRPLHSTKGLFCSELVARFFAAACLRDFPWPDPECATPEMVKQYCLSHPELFKRI